MDCPNVFPLRILSRKWSYFVLRTLQTPKGFSEIHRELRFVTNRMLSRELKLLEQEGLIANKGAYQLTRPGKELLDALSPLASWSLRNRQCVACPPERQCSTCHNYPTIVGALQYQRSKA